MFATNQKLTISGDISEDAVELQNALVFALNLSGHLDSFEDASKHMRCVYQRLKDGRVILGWKEERPQKDHGKDTGAEWRTLPFDFDVALIAQIIRQWINKQDVEDEYEDMDGSCGRGFLLKEAALEYDTDEYELVQEPWREIISIEPYICHYAP